MISRRLLAGVAACACACLVYAAVATALPGTSIVYHAGSGTTPVPAGGVIMNATSDPATVAIGGGTLTCTQTTVTATMANNGMGTVTPTVDSTTLRGCSDTLPNVNIGQCDGTDSRLTVTRSFMTWDGLSLRCPATGGACYYGVAGLEGTWSNDSAAATFSFGGQPITHSVPAGATDDLGNTACGTNGTFGVGLTRMMYAGSGTYLTIFNL